MAAGDSGMVFMRAAASPKVLASSRPAQPRASRGFDELLQQLQPPASPDEREETENESVRQAMMKLVSTALILPALATLRDSPFREGAFAPGTAERRFGPLLDQAVADRVVAGANFPLIDVMVERASALPGIDAVAAGFGSLGERLRAGTPRAMEVNRGGI